MKNQILFPFICALFALTFMSCEVEIPDVDVEAPTFTFRISGPGINKTYDQDDDLSTTVINLKQDATYSFTFTGADAGGVEKIQWQCPQDDMHSFTTLSPTNVNIINLNSFSRILELSGDEANPLSALVISGTLKTKAQSPGHSDSFNWGLYVRDFGGASGPGNTVDRTMYLSIVPEGDPIGEFSY